MYCNFIVLDISLFTIIFARPNDSEYAIHLLKSSIGTIIKWRLHKPPFVKIKVYLMSRKTEIEHVPFIEVRYTWNLASVYYVSECFYELSWNSIIFPKFSFDYFIYCKFSINVIYMTFELIRHRSWSLVFLSTRMCY